MPERISPAVGGRSDILQADMVVSSRLISLRKSDDAVLNRKSSPRSSPPCRHGRGRHRLRTMHNTQPGQRLGGRAAHIQGRERLEHVGQVRLNGCERLELQIQRVWSAFFHWKWTFVRCSARVEETPSP